MTTPNIAALAAYRHVLRATRVAFQGDSRMLVSARHQARSSFNLGRSWTASNPETTAAIAHAEDVAKILRQNVVQGQRIEEEEGSEKYKLRIHEETERGDNDSVKKANNPGNLGRGRCGGA